MTGDYEDERRLRGGRWRSPRRFVTGEATYAFAEEVMLHDGGAGLAADPHHEGPVRQEVQGASPATREARRRLHSVAGLLHPPQRLAHVGREEVQHGGVGLAVARRLHRGRLLPQDQRAHRRRSGVSRRSSRTCTRRRCKAYATYPYKSENYYGFPQMPDVLVNYYRKDIFCNEDEQKNFQAKYNKKLPCTRRGDGRHRLGRRSRTSASSSCARRARSWPASRSTTISTASPSRPARATTSRPCRSTASSGSMAATSGTRPRRPTAMPKAS